MKSGNTSITIHGIYHPPYSLRNKCSNNMFLDDFTNYLTNILPDPDLSNHIILGDFNLHISEDPNEIEPATFIDTIEAVGLYQHIGFDTHKQGITLDLILSEIGDTVQIKSVTPGPFLSSHRAVIACLTAKKATSRSTTRFV